MKIRGKFLLHRARDVLNVGHTSVKTNALLLAILKLVQFTIAYCNKSLPDFIPPSTL